MSPQALSAPRLALKRLAGSRLLLTSIFASIIIASTMAAAAPAYLQSIERLALDMAIEGLVRPQSNINAFAFSIPLTSDGLVQTERSLVDSIERHLSHIYDGHERFLVLEPYLAAFPSDPPRQPGTAAPRPSRANFRHLSNMEPRVDVLEGRMAGSAVVTGPRGPTVEAVISPTTAEMFGLQVGHVVTLAKRLDAGPAISARIVGVVQAVNPTEDYWKPHARLYLDPPPVQQPEPGLEIDYDPSRPPAPLFVTKEAMAEAVSSTYPGTMVDSLWFILADRQRLKDWSSAEGLRRLNDFEVEISSAMPGLDMFTGITRVLNSYDRRSFFSRVPLLLLMVMTAATALFYMAMVVSYLARSREGEVALLRTRGVGSVQIMRLYAMEGLVFSAVAVVLAPFLAFGLVALAGKLPYFRDMTAGGFLPVELGPGPFLWAGGAGALCMSIYVIAGAIGARSGLLVHKLRSSRPPTVPFFQRYYLDIALLALGGLVFWELHSRGHLVSGGLFKDVEVNETLLLAPVLFLVVVALVFIRMFPLLVRFISGESPALLHLAVVATLLALATAVAVRGLREDGGLGWLGPLALLLAVGVAYWATGRATRMGLRLAGIVAQAGLVGGFLALEPPVSGLPEFAPAIALMSLVPAQVAFILLKASVRRAPAWISMGLWHMARNPLQYTWLVLLLVLVTGIGLLSTTVGGSLERSQEDRILYDVAADVRVSGIPPALPGGTQALKDAYLRIPGVASVSLALRQNGQVGPTPVEVLAVESSELQYTSWYYREDFSSIPLSDIMTALRSHERVERLAIPERATSIGVWAKPEERSSNPSMWAVIEDARGAMMAVSLGTPGPPEWQPLRASIPPLAEFPLYLSSVQILETSSLAQEPGTLLLDDVHVTLGPGDQEQVLEDFEGQMNWVPIVAAAFSSDRAYSTGRDVHGGSKAVSLSFGQGNQRGIRGLYQSPTGGAVPIVVSSSFSASTGARVNDALLVEIAGRLVPMVVRDTVEYFPTMVPDGGGFVLVDLDNLTQHLKILDPTSAVEPNEAFLTAAPGADQSVQETLDALVGTPGVIRYRAAQLAAIRRDPLTSAGLRSMVLISLGVVVLGAGLGYTVHILSIASISSSEMGFLRSLGVSRHELMGLLGFEHIAIMVLGIGLGTWAGLQMSRLMVSSVAVTETGDQAVPPFILTTDWGLMLPTYAALLAIFLAALYAVSRSIQRLDLNAVSRAEGL